MLNETTQRGFFILFFFFFYMSHIEPPFRDNFDRNTESFSFAEEQR